MLLLSRVLLMVLAASCLCLLVSSQDEEPPEEAEDEVATDTENRTSGITEKGTGGSMEVGPGDEFDDMDITMMDDTPAPESHAEFIIRNHIDSIPQPGDACVYHEGQQKNESTLEFAKYEVDYYNALTEVLEMRVNNESDQKIGESTKKWCMHPFLYCNATESKCKCKEIDAKLYTPDCYGTGWDEKDPPSNMIQLEEEFDKYDVLKVCVRPEGSLCGVRDSALGNCKNGTYCRSVYKHGKSESFCGKCIPIPTTNSTTNEPVKLKNQASVHGIFFAWIPCLMIIYKYVKKLL